MQNSFQSGTQKHLLSANYGQLVWKCDHVSVMLSPCERKLANDIFISLNLTHYPRCLLFKTVKQKQNQNKLNKKYSKRSQTGISQSRWKN